MATPKPTLQQHARLLAKANNVRLAEVHGDEKPEKAFALTGIRVVVCSEIHDETTYAIALHEIGHLSAAVGALLDRPRTLNVMQDEEDAAWNWARHYALEWTPLMEQVASLLESSYHPPVDEAQPVPPSTPAKPVPPLTRPTPVKQINWDDWK